MIQRYGKKNVFKIHVDVRPPSASSCLLTLEPTCCFSQTGFGVRILVASGGGAAGGGQGGGRGKIRGRSKIRCDSVMGRTECGVKNKTKGMNVE